MKRIHFQFSKPNVTFPLLSGVSLYKSNFTVTDLEEAFKLNGEDFVFKYGFPKPSKDASNLVIGCRSGRRAMTAVETLNKMGYNSIR